MCIRDRVNRINEIAEEGVVSSNGAELNIRSLPDDNAEIVGKLSDGAAIRIISKGSNWTKIAIGDNGETAYVKTAYIMDLSLIHILMPVLRTYMIQAWILH